MYEESVLLMLQSHFPEIKVTRSEVVKETLWPQGVKLNNPWERNAVTGYVIQFP